VIEAGWYEDEDEERGRVRAEPLHASRWPHPTRPSTIHSPPQLPFFLRKYRRILPRGILHTSTPSAKKVFVVAVDGEDRRLAELSNILLDIAVLRSLDIKGLIVLAASPRRCSASRASRHLAIHESPTPKPQSPMKPTLKITIEAATFVMHEVEEGLTPPSTCARG